MCSSLSFSVHIHVFIQILEASGHYIFKYSFFSPSGVPMIHMLIHLMIFHRSCRLWSFLQSFPATGCFPVSQIFTSSNQGNGASASVLPINIKGWFPLGLTSLISLQSTGLSRVFSNTTVQKHQFFDTQFPYGSTLTSHIHTWLLEKP